MSRLFENNCPKPQLWSTKEPIEETEEAEKTEDEFDVSDYRGEFLRLEEELRRAKQQIRDMSEGYESQFEDNIKRQGRFIAKLNS